MQWLTAFMLSVAVSLDGLAAGWAYGLSGMKMPWYSRIVTNSVTIAVVAVAMKTGQLINGIFVSPRIPVVLGGFTLFGVGLALLVRALANHEPQMGREINGPILTVQMSGLIVQILRQPLNADVDRSGSISPGEAAVLGLALAADAFGAGLGIGLSGTWPVWTPLLAGLCQFFFLSAGVYFGQMPTLGVWKTRLRWFPGLLLATLGLIRLL